MIDQRINDPVNIDHGAINAEIERGNRVILQFSKTEAYPSNFSQLNALCEKYGDLLEVRFYGHYGTAFDGAVLGYLPSVKALSVDCLTNAIRLESIRTLQHLERFSFGVYNWADGEFLKSINLSNLQRLVLTETRTGIIDISSVCQAAKLQEFYVSGQTKGLSTISSLPELRLLSLGSIPKHHTLDFVSSIPSLRRLVIILGGRIGIPEISHAHLSELEILRVKGFSDMGNLARFPSLAHLVIEDQIQLRGIQISVQNEKLSYLRIANCKQLERIIGLHNAVGLQHMRIAMTAVSVEDLLLEKLPNKLRTFAIHTGRVRENKSIRARLDALGYTE